jgi:CRISPR-associated exonuclease Cas4
MIVSTDDDLLLLSGIQHMAFCERQWALIHIEQVWAESSRTVEGKHLHERADDPYFDETRKNLRIVRGMPLVSHRLGLRGVADVVEFYQCENHNEKQCCRLSDRQGWWRPAPVEYKRGKPKPDDRDAVQLCAQAMALEEMLNVEIREGFLFYAQVKRREAVAIDEALRVQTIELAVKMHEYTRKGFTPVAPQGRRCSLCSLVEQCQPQLTLKHRSVAKYLAEMCQLGGE